MTCKCIDCQSRTFKSHRCNQNELIFRIKLSFLQGWKCRCIRRVSRGSTIENATKDSSVVMSGKILFLRYTEARDKTFLLTKFAFAHYINVHLPKLCRLRMLSDLNQLGMMVRMLSRSSRVHLFAQCPFLLIYLYPLELQRYHHSVLRKDCRDKQQ